VFKVSLGFHFCAFLYFFYTAMPFLFRIFSRLFLFSSQHKNTPVEVDCDCWRNLRRIAGSPAARLSGLCPAECGGFLNGRNRILNDCQFYAGAFAAGKTTG
jgi:hypothetical protein